MALPIQRLKLLSLFVVIYVFAYLLAGGLAYLLITKQFYVGDHAIFTSYLRSEAYPELWAHVNTWQFPLLFIKSILVALVLLPFVGTFAKYPFWKSSVVIFVLLFVLTHLASSAPSPGNIEGIIYVKPELISPTIFALIQPEMILQTALVATGFTYVIKNKAEL